jgi:hypothetical protein
LANDARSEYVPALEGAERERFKTAMLDEWKILAATGELRPERPTAGRGIKALPRGHAPGQATFNFGGGGGSGGNPDQSRDDHGRFASGPGGNFHRAEARRRSRRRKHRRRLKTRHGAYEHQSAHVQISRDQYREQSADLAHEIRSARAELHEAHRDQRRSLVRSQRREARLLPEKHEKQRDKLAEIQERSDKTGGQSPTAQYNRLERHAGQERDLVDRHAAELRDQPREHLRARNALLRTQAAERRAQNADHFERLQEHHSEHRVAEARDHRDERKHRITVKDDEE